jgi:polyisoprenoid-binding protein YceI
MNNGLLVDYLTLIIAFLLFGCGGAAKEENKNNASAGSVSQGQKYMINTKESVVTWEGSMLIASKEEHAGYVYLSKGELLIEKDQLVGGTFEIDMNTMEYKDKQHKNSPIMHLKSPDFFDVEKFPTSAFVITGVAPANDGNIKVTGNLTIKGVTKAVTFPAGIEVKDGMVKANGKLVIDRTEWGIRYKSGKFYDIIADEIVSDEIEFLMEIVAGK